MIFTETPLHGAFLIEPERLEDQRGYFARTWCRDEFAARGLNHCLVQCSISLSRKQGTLRGMHYQAPPYQEAKLVRCTKGAIYDVILDLRPHSDTFKRWVAVKLTAENHHMLYIPEGFAHGLQTLQDNTEVFYQMSEFYHPEYVRGIRWNDRSFAVSWPISNPILSDRDRNYPDYNEDITSVLLGGALWET